MNRPLQRSLQTLGAALGAALLRLWARSFRVVERGRELAEPAWAKGPVVVVFWHSRFLFLPFIYPPERTIGVLISSSRDGDVIASIIERLGRQVVRGSSRRGGKQALDEMDTRMREGWDVGIAADGPLGPPYECKLGPVVLAQRHRTAIVLLTYTTKRGIALKTWDRFWMPPPLTTVFYHWGEPMTVAADADVETANAELNRRMRQLVVDTEAWAGRQPPWT